MKSETKKCDQCDTVAVQHITTENGRGPEVFRCSVHAVPGYDVARTWTVSVLGGKETR